MSTRTRKTILWLLSVTVGAAFGYLLFHPLVTLPAESVVYGLKPLLQSVSGKFTSHEAEGIFQMVIVLFVMNLPNTVLLSIITAVTLSWLQYGRALLYATLLWPFFLHIAHWLLVGALKLGALRLGLTTDTERLPVMPGFQYTAVLILCTVAVYLPLVLLLDRSLSKRRHNNRA